MTTLLQCISCKNNVKLEYRETRFDFKYRCDKYPIRIPSYVDEGTKDCSKFEEREDNVLPV